MFLFVSNNIFRYTRSDTALYRNIYIYIYIYIYRCVCVAYRLHFVITRPLAHEGSKPKITSKIACFDARNLLHL